ncbi:hypothetical protein ACPA9J_32345 [Pseudomonas aeruginosa]
MLGGCSQQPLLARQRRPGVLIERADGSVQIPDGTRRPRCGAGRRPRRPVPRLLVFSRDPALRLMHSVATAA